MTNILDGRSLPVYGDGTNIRDWLYVVDHARGIERVLNAGIPAKPTTLAGNNEWANLAIVELLCDHLDARFASEPTLAARFPKSPAANGESRGLIQFVDDRAGHDWRYAIDARQD